MRKPRRSRGRGSLGLGEVVHDLAALQVVGQGCPAVGAAPADGLVLRRFRSDPAFAATAEAVLQGRVEFAAQLGVLGAQPGQLGQHLAEQRVQGRHVIGQRHAGGEGGGVHA